MIEGVIVDLLSCPSTMTRIDPEWIAVVILGSLDTEAAMIRVHLVMCK
jgi:hypothetical protein